MEGIIFKALSGFYYVDCGGELLTCRARGKFRHEKITPLVGDRVRVTTQGDGTGTVDAVLPRKNQFWRPAVANIDYLVVVASGAIPVTDPFLIDRVVAVAERQGCESVICFNKWDLEQPQALYETYRTAGFPTLRVSAETGEGLEELSALIAGKVCAFTGNSGVGKSSILNALEPDFHLRVGDVSEKLGRGRHTTRHVELYRLKNGAVIADTPGFASFEEEGVGCPPEELQYAFREFAPYLGQCRFLDCAHVKEQGCAALEALSQGKLSQTRHDSYVRLYRQAKEIPEWQRRSAKDPRTK
ncbi:MAG: ribosome small subunit-dependent GTPase A [Oscillospiraceae bacterium]|jgi:ribosome biogenesis GTPase|nr:ribosome small subunit-dependent GTPase A [Oscillospiraceae bacterium]